MGGTSSSNGSYNPNLPPGCTTINGIMTCNNNNGGSSSSNLPPGCSIVNGITTCPNNASPNTNVNNNSNTFNCQQSFNNLLNSSKWTGWITFVLLIIFLIAVACNIAIITKKCKTMKDSNTFYKVGNFIFFIIILLGIIGMIIGIYNSMILYNWLNNPNNQQTYVNKCNVVNQALQNYDSGNQGGNQGPNTGHGVHWGSPQNNGSKYAQTTQVPTNGSTNQSPINGTINQPSNGINTSQPPIGSSNQSPINVNVPHLVNSLGNSTNSVPNYHNYSPFTSGTWSHN